MAAALVTGGSGGIGAAICQALAQAGYAVAIHYSGNQRAAEELKQILLESGCDAEVFRADIRSESDVLALLDGVVARFGSLDVLVNNAGITRDRLLVRMSLSEWQEVIDTNLSGAFLTSRAAAKIMMKQRRGSIINITSVVGIGGNAGQANYAAAKAGMIGLTKSLAKELAPRGVTCNAVAPGFIDAGMAAGLPEEVKKAYLDSIPLRRAGLPGEVADAVCYLAQSTYITGQVLRVDGGMGM